MGGQPIFLGISGVVLLAAARTNISDDNKETNLPIRRLRRGQRRALSRRTPAVVKDVAEALHEFQGDKRIVIPQEPHFIWAIT